MDIIHLLPDSVANQIAAGEVVQRPASCLKELVENALDAGAQRIQIIVQDAGKTLLQVIDDGKGMSYMDARMAFERHATSKIAQASDLFSLHTMGFRGEALASIAAVAQVEMLTKRPEDEVGTMIEIDGSKVVQQEPVQAPNGTSIKVKNLFYNVPARRRFLKTDTTELRNLITDFTRIALVYPEIHFTFVSEGEILFDLPAVSYKQRIESLFGKSNKTNYVRQLVEAHTSTPLVEIQGFIGKPENASRNPQQFLFVNGRFMRHPYFNKAILTAYSGMLPPDRMPSYFLYFTVAPDAIDVNIHPTKTEIKFADEQPIWQIVQAMVREALGRYNLIPPLDFNREGAIDIPVMSAHNTAVAPPQMHINTAYNPFEGNRIHDYTPFLPTPAYPLPTQEMRDDNTAAPTAPALFETTDGEASCLYKDKYLLCPCQQGLMVIDSVRAYQKVLYETLSVKWQDKRGTMQPVLFPEVMDFEAADTQLLLDMMSDLNLIGFDIARLGPNSFSINAVPSQLEASAGAQVLMDILHTVREAAGTVQTQWKQMMVSTIARHIALRKKALTAVERKDLLTQLFALPDFALTPDGKRVYFLLTDDQIAQYFD